MTAHEFKVEIYLKPWHREVLVTGLLSQGLSMVMALVCVAISEKITVKYFSKSVLISIHEEMQM